MNALFASAFSRRASFTSSSEISAPRSSLLSSGEGAEEGGVEAEEEGDDVVD